MNIKWDAEEYTDRFRFVHRYGEDVLDLITAKPGALAVDLGCGNGALTEKLHEKGYRVVGIDASRDMLKIAKERHKELSFYQADAVSFTLQEKADVIFSNAVFHWIDDQDALLSNLYEQLKEGGELVFEFGGKGCAELVHGTLEKEFEKRGLSYSRTFYFPSIGEYAPLLEKHGFKVTYATLFDRPTPQMGEHGVEDFIRMFVTRPFEGMEAATADEIIRETEEQLKETLFHDGTWFIDYVRIRMRAEKV